MSHFSQQLLAHNVSSEDVERSADVALEESDAGKTFADLNLPVDLLRGLHGSGFLRPSPIQLKSLPLARLGLDLLLQAKSGTGKTLVFTSAALLGIDYEKVSSLQVIILAPTREVAVQANRVALDIGTGYPRLKAHSFIGGLSLEDDLAKVRRCHLACGTPGRIRQLIEEKHMKTEAVRLFVLDEADKLMDKSFVNDVTWIFNKLPTTKQVIASSATYPEELAKMVEKFMKNPAHIRLGKEDQVLKGIGQYVMKVKPHPVISHQVRLKTDALFSLLNSLSFSQCLLFCNYALRAESLSNLAEERGWPSIFISSSQDQHKRLKAINKLKQFQIRLLFSTDLTARGIDAQNVDLVINIDVPWDSETYLHRIGRAGRFGTRALAITLASENEELESLRKIVFKTGSKILNLPPVKEWADDFDLWESPTNDFESLEGLESKEEEEEKHFNGIFGKKKSKKKRGSKKKKEKSYEASEEDVIDITKAWVPVNVKEEEDFVYENEYESAKKELKNHMNKFTENCRNENIPSVEEIRDKMLKSLNGEINLPENMDQEEEKCPKRVQDASNLILQTRNEEFELKFDRVKTKLGSISLREAFDYVKEGKAKEYLENDFIHSGHEQQAEEDLYQEEEEEAKYCDYQKCEADQEEIVGDFRSKLRISSRDEDDSEDLPNLNPNRLIPKSFDPNDDLPNQNRLISKLFDPNDNLPNPNPNRLIPRSFDPNDLGWMSKWLKEVGENKEFIHDMELLKRMSK